MKFKNHTLFVIGFVALASCEQFLEVELPGQEPRLVLNALLEPTDTLKVYLTKSKGILDRMDFNEEFDLVEGASVAIKDQEGQLFPMSYIDRSRPYESNAFYYINGLEFKEGHTYEIVAEKDNFPSISSIQEFPNKVKIKSIDVVNLGPIERFENHDEFEVTVKFDDPQERNFYEISGRIIGNDTITVDGEMFISSYHSDLAPRPVNPVYQKEYLFRNVLLFEDGILNGADSEIVFRTWIPRSWDIEVTISLSHVSESYYRFYDTADLQRSNSGDVLSQPVLVYNNINNGMGIFKSRNSDQMVIEIAKEE